jgi:hypothetical protein
MVTSSDRFGRHERRQSTRQHEMASLRAYTFRRYNVRIVERGFLLSVVMAGKPGAKCNHVVPSTSRAGRVWQDATKPESKLGRG